MFGGYSNAVNNSVRREKALTIEKVGSDSGEEAARFSTYSRKVGRGCCSNEKNRGGEMQFRYTSRSRILPLQRAFFVTKFLPAAQIPG